ncbi:protein LEG1 homolog [Discoglossus pictus]
MALFSKINVVQLICLLLCFSFANFKEISIEDEYPPLWGLAIERIEDLNIQNEKATINAWNYIERLGIYKLLLNMSSPYLDMKEPSNKRNILWGLPLQLGWQFHTGRLQDKSEQNTSGLKNEDRTHISERSWWACMNYYLSVIPFLGASDAGLFTEFPQIEISHPSEFSFDFCFNISDCHSSASQAMTKWKAFFELIMAPRKLSNISVPPLSTEEDEFLLYMWEAHVESISIALPRCSKRLQYLSTPEGNFGQDWATAVDFIAATHFPTNFESTNKFQVFLPHRMLVDGDKAPFISDFSDEENRVLAALKWIRRMNKITGGLLLRLWKKAMCSKEGRAAGRDLLQNMVTEPNFAPQKILDIIKALVKNPTC